MIFPLWIIGVITIAETILVVMVFLFFLRLRRSEVTLAQLQSNQEHVLESIYRNAALEQELVDSFSQRQEQLIILNKGLEERIRILQKLIDQAASISRSPQFLREVILAGKKKGQTPAQIARSTGLAVDEVELILSRMSN